MPPERRLPPDDAEPVPVFGSWPRSYAAVLLTELATLLLIELFSLFPY